ncbi:PiggyBac transposable element-derived protein 2 [Trichinella spiralis]|uniref:PiggyBac transposable element-derived protein 2 n=1 Tax=Trichinella spiralis TaxID=6334 RepID=A0A0V1BUT6_TRISP|nr:PiggyBac transposable element-derived protein 2 [Trichinella spiralis]
MDFDTVFRETRSGRNVRQITVLPDPDVSESDARLKETMLPPMREENHTSGVDDQSDEKSSVLRPIEYFRMYFTPQLLFHISFETNRKATQCLYSNLATTVAEIEVLIGMLTTMGVSEMPRYRMYWANQTRMDTVANCMSRNRFETLLRFLHFNDNDKAVMDRSHLDYDRFYKIRPLIESMRKTCLEETLGELQSVDEHIIPYKGRCKMKYYNPRNPDKWRLKVIARCAKNGFVHDFWLCDGMAPKVKNPVGFFAADVVMKVCETLPKHKGDGIHSVATIRSNRLRGCPVMPSNKLKRKGRGATDFCCTKDNKLCVVKWLHNREVILASTYHCVDPVTPVRRWNKRQRQFIDVPCPQIRIDHKCRKWHRRIFFWAIHVSLTNSWLKYKDDCTKKGIKPRNMMDLMTFMLSVSDSLIKLEKTYVTRKRGRPQAELTVEEEAGPSRPVRRTRQPEDITRADQTGHWPEMMTTKKRCRSQRKKRRKGGADTNHVAVTHGYNRSSCDLLRRLLIPRCNKRSKRLSGVNADGDVPEEKNKAEAEPPTVTENPLQRKMDAEMDSVITNTGVSEKYTMKQEPFEEIPTTSGQAAESAAYCPADDNEIRVTAGAGMGRIRLSAAGTTSCLPFLRRKLLPVVYCLTVRKDLPIPDPDFSRQLSSHPGTRLVLPLLPSCFGRSAAFLPVHLVPTGFEIINVGTSGQVEALFQYFQQEWLPATKIPLWNIHGVAVRTMKDLPTDRRIFKYYIPKRKNLASKLIWPLIPAIQGNFPNTRAQGWFFHFCQAVLRQVGRLGLRTDYMNNQEVRKKVKVLMALAFLPVHLVPTGFEIINVGTSGQVEALFQYFQQEWLPATKIPLWNIHGVSVRTNNHLEGWHSRMNKSARKHHLGFYQFLQLILDEQGKTVLVMRQIDDGCTHGRGSVRRSAAYGVQQRRVAALTSRLVHNEISVQQILSAQSYHTPEPLRLYACGEKQKYLCAKQSAD